MKSSRPKVAYVKTLEVIYGFNGMKSANEEYRVQQNVWQANIDTLRLQYEQKVKLFKENETTYSNAQKDTARKQIQDLETNIRKYTQAIDDQAKESETKITEGVLNQINSFIESYAKKKGYDIIFGTDGSGSIMYGVETFDITAEVIAELNKEYKVLPGK